MAEELSSLLAAKRRRKVLIVENKLKVLKLVDSGTSYSSMELVNLLLVTLRKIELNWNSSRSKLEMGIKTANIKAMKFGEHKELDEALYIWFRQAT